MAKKSTARTAWYCVRAELVGIDLGKGRLCRPGLTIAPSTEYHIGNAINTGRAFIIRRTKVDVKPFTHLVSWPGMGLFLCHLGPVPPGKIPAPEKE